jgi:hypothetical protein
LEILALRHQLGVLQRSVKRPKLSPADRVLWAWLSSIWTGWESRVSIVQAATVIGWQRKGFGSRENPLCRVRKSLEEEELMMS